MPLHLAFGLHGLNKVITSRGMPNDRIHGCVESVSETAIDGWIANLDCPDTLATVVCNGEDAETSCFVATTPRADIANRLGVVGCFGFSIPVSAIRQLGLVVRITSMDGNILEGGGAVALPPPTSVEATTPVTWTVLHIQKAAGTSLRMALSKVIPPSSSVFVYDNPIAGISIGQLNQLSLAQRAALKLVMGHLYFGVDSFVSHPPAYITVLRQPFARLRSHYHHHVSYGVTFDFCGANLALTKVVQHGLTDEFDNLMTRTIAGTAPQVVPIGAVSEALVDLAIENIRTKFRFVCLTEEMDTHFPQLCSTMGLSAPTMPRINSDRIVDAPVLDAAVDWNEVMYRNRFDVLLYKRAQDEGLCGRDLSIGRH